MDYKHIPHTPSSASRAAAVHTPAIIALILIALILLAVSVLTYRSSPQRTCTVVDRIPASLEVELPLDAASRQVVGFNTDTTMLSFGKVSPRSSVQRSVSVNFSQDALVSVVMEGDLKGWTTIAPEQFSLHANETKTVFFDVDVPWAAGRGMYTGTALFCFQEQ